MPANALTFLLYLLAQHPEVFAQLLDELDQVLGGDPPPFEEIWRLPMLDKVFRESLRVLSPGLPVIVRRQDRQFHRSKAQIRGQLHNMVECP